MAWSPPPNARRSPAKAASLWTPQQNPSSLWPSGEMEGHDCEGSKDHEVASRWFMVDSGTEQGGVDRVHQHSRRFFALSTAAPVFCDDCQLFFRRPGDLKRHKCRAERNLPVQDQLGAVHCTKCDRWFRSKGGFAVHKCAQPASSELPAMPLRSSSDRSCCAAHCEICNRCFKSKAGFAKLRPGKTCVSSRSGFVPVCVPRCQRQFRRRQDLTRHLNLCTSVS